MADIGFSYLGSMGILSHWVPAYAACYRAQIRSKYLELTFYAKAVRENRYAGGTGRRCRNVLRRQFQQIMRKIYIYDGFNSICMYLAQALGLGEYSNRDGMM
jgi:hypothetical protein